MKESYGDIQRFRPASLDLISICDGIVSDWSARGFKLTIRQLFYQLVARKVRYGPQQKVFENTVQNYDNIVQLMTNARLAGLIDWDAIEDRTREVIERSHWTGVKSMLDSAATWYHEDLWAEQPTFVLGVVEKEALAGVFEQLFKPWDIPLLPARGYPSATALRDIGKYRIMDDHREIVVLHFGDHDPSGIDMSRDLRERLNLFARTDELGISIDFRRMALNMDQVRELNPPPNPARTTDARYESYRALYGDQSWELDAVSPDYLRELIRAEVEPLIDFEQWDKTKDRIERRRAELVRIRREYKELED